MLISLFLKKCRSQQKVKRGYQKKIPEKDAFYLTANTVFSSKLDNNIAQSNVIIICYITTHIIICLIN